MGFVDLSGTAGGAGDVLPTDPLLVLYLLGSTSGESTTSASFGLNQILSASAQGFGDLLDPWIQTQGAAFAGTSLVSTPSTVGVLNFYAPFYGSSELTLSEPTPIFGQGVTSASMEVARNLIACPVARAKQIPIEVRWGQMLTRGDLPLYLDEGPMRPFAPYLLSYTLYLIREGGYAQQVGASGRTPVMARVGEFYATGEAGVGGQPGLWRITWKWQRSAGMPFETYSYNFRVTDAATLNDPNDTTPRCRKYGWL